MTFDTSFGNPATSAPTFGTTPSGMQQQNPAVDNAVTSLVTSLTFPMLHGDERDATIAKWKQLPAYWGTGKEYYHPNDPPVESTPENPFCCFKDKGYCEDSNQEKSNLWGTVKETAGAVAANKFVQYGAAAGLAVAVAPALVTAAGFGTGGVVAGTAAAGFQSAWFGGTIGGVTGCMFSGLQSIGAAGLGVAGKAVVAGTGGAAVGIYDTIKGKSRDDKACGSAAAEVQSAWFDEATNCVPDSMFSGLQSIRAAGLGVAGKAVVAGTGGAAVGMYDSIKGKSKDDKTGESAAAGVQSAWFGETINSATGSMFSGLQSIGAAGLGVAGKAVVAGTGGAAVGMYDSIKGKSKDDKTGESAAAGVQSAWFGETINSATGSMLSGLQSIGAAGLGIAGKAVAAGNTVVTGTGNAAVGIYGTIKGKFKDDKDCQE